eukprot:1214044-Heterocapsa_arctica.AAC.1
MLPRRPCPEAALQFLGASLERPQPVFVAGRIPQVLPGPLPTGLDGGPAPVRSPSSMPPGANA